MNIEKLYAFAPRARVLENEPLARHTTFRVGGPADVLFLPESAEELQRAMELAREAGMCERSFRALSSGCPGQKSCPAKIFSSSVIGNFPLLSCVFAQFSLW